MQEHYISLKENRQRHHQRLTERHSPTNTIVQLAKSQVVVVISFLHVLALCICVCVCVFG